MAVKSNKTKICDLNTDDVFKVTIPVRVRKITKDVSSIGVMNDVVSLRNIELCINEGCFTGTIAKAVLSSDDKVEVLSRGKRTLWTRVKQAIKRMVRNG